jgi:hypothetical protein
MQAIIKNNIKKKAQGGGLKPQTTPVDTPLLQWYHSKYGSFSSHERSW